MQPTSSTGQIGPRQRAAASPLFLQGRGSIDAASQFTRGPLAERALRLLGLGPVGSARLGQKEPALRSAFGGDVTAWGQIGTPWIAARCLARPVDTLPSQSSVGWLLGNRGR